MKTLETRNAQITEAVLMMEDHGGLTAWVHLDYGDSRQSFGGYPLFYPHIRSRFDYTGIFVAKALSVAGVLRWDRLPGTIVRVRGDEGNIVEIGHALRDIWFNPKEEFAKVRDAVNALNNVGDDGL